MFKRILAGLGLFALVLTGLTVAPMDNDTSPIFGVVTQQMAYADSTPFEGSPTAVSVSKMWTAPYSRMRMAFIKGDTAAAKHVIPGMANGDYVTSAMYIPWDTLACAAGGPNRNVIDLTDSAYFYHDTLAFYNGDGAGMECDSGTVIILWNDATD